MIYQQLNEWITNNFTCKIPMSEAVKMMANQGLLAMLISKNNGGLELSFKEFGLVIETLAAIDMNLAVLVAGHNVTSFALAPLIGQRKDIKLLGAAITEKSSGSNPRSITSFIKKEKENLILNGQKYYAGLASMASHMVILAKSLEEKFIVALVPTDRKGVIIGDKINTIGLTDIPKHHMTFDNVILNEKDILFGPTNNIDGIQKIMHLARLSIGFMGIGILRECSYKMMQHASTRQIQTGLQLDNPSVRNLINRTLHYLNSLEKLRDKINFDSPENVLEEEVIVFKNCAAEFANKAADWLIQIYGGSGYEQESIASRLWRDSRAMRIFEGPTEALNLHLGMLLIKNNKWAEIKKEIKEALSNHEGLDDECKDYALFAIMGEIFTAHQLGEKIKSKEFIEEKIRWYKKPKFEKIMVRQQGKVYTQSMIVANAHLALKKLKDLGLNKGDKVLLIFDKCPMLISLIYACRKAGYAFMMMAPSAASDRLQNIVNDLNPKVIITATDYTWCDEAFNTSDVEDIDILPDAPCYYVPTSGTTGIPNIIEVSFASANKMVEETRNAYSIDENSIIYSFCSLDFDVAISDILTAITYKACIVLPARPKVLPDDILATELKDHKVTHIQLVPSALKVLPHLDFPHLKHIVLGGEQCSMDLVKKWMVDGRKIYNAYGPAEATVVTTVYCFTGNEIDVIPIGKPLDGKKLLITDEGELWISGWLANGYVNKPELNNIRFVKEKNSQERMYKTGDLVRMHVDGNLEFVGRIDNQIKFNGVRIEPEEIEKHLKRLPQIIEALVCVDKQLMAFINSDKPISSTYLKDELSKNLSQTVIPSLFYLTDDFNYSHVGKIDRKKLPRADKCILLTNNNNLSQFSENEMIILAIWKRVLGNIEFTPETNFFHTGGDSLAAVRIANEFRKEFNCNVEIDAFFENETIRKQALMITI